MINVINPSTAELLHQYPLDEASVLENKLTMSAFTFEGWKYSELSERVSLFKKMALLLEEHQEELALMVTREMGKPLVESKAEIQKCAWLTNHYCENVYRWMELKCVEADGLEHFIRYEPLGVILSIMPWNFPFWQVFRFAVPAILVGNVTLLKHSNQVPGCALLIQDLFHRAGFPLGVFQTLLTNHQSIETMIADDRIAAISFTGSTEAGSAIGSIAGKHIKKVVMELGGSDPFMVLSDANLCLAAKGAVMGRFLNAGQSCIAAKRFLVMENVANEFVNLFVQSLQEKSMGDPMTCDLGPLVSEKAVLQMQAFVSDALEKGARLVCGGKRRENLKGYYFEPTILADVTSQMRVMNEEVFGPLASIMTLKSEEEMLKVANQTAFGLGASIWTKDLSKGKLLALKVECGSVFINSIVKSDPRMPFGGIKKSGVGRELSKYGLREFVNIKGHSIYEGL